MFPQEVDMTFSPLGTNPVRADYMDFIYSFWTAYTTVVYLKPTSDNKVKLYIKPFRYQVRTSVNLFLFRQLWCTCFGSVNANVKMFVFVVGLDGNRRFNTLLWIDHFSAHKGIREVPGVSKEQCIWSSGLQHAFRLWFIYRSR